MLRVFILAHHSMFGQGVASLLRREAEIEVVGIAIDTERALNRIGKLKPNVVILEETGLNGDAARIVMRLLRATPSGRVIGLNLEENTLHLYCEEHWRSETVQDLVRALKTSLTTA